MDQLVNLISERAGISPDQAQTAATTVIGFLKDRLPGPLASQIDSVMSGNMGDMAGQAQNMLGGLGGMFGGNKNT